MQRQFLLLCLSTLFIFTSNRTYAQPDASYSTSTESAYQDVSTDNNGDFVMSFPPPTQSQQSSGSTQPTIIINNPPQTQSNPNYYYSAPNEYPYDFDPYAYDTYGGYGGYGYGYPGALDNRARDQGFDNGFRGGAGGRSRF